MPLKALAAYRKKRDFATTLEPRGVSRRGSRGLVFVVQKHRASHLHYDLRLEMEGVLKSWALPKGPSLNPKEKHLAVRVEDHPYEYRNFEGTIAAGNYGAGDVIVWDSGTYEPAHGDGESAVLKALRKGALSVRLHGKKLNGEFALIRLKRPRQWLLIKKNDEFASERDVTRDDRSVISRVKSMHKPDYLVIDLDPGNNSFDEVVVVAQAVREAIENAGGRSYAKTSEKPAFMHTYRSARSTNS